MDVVDLPVVRLREVPWNPNVTDDRMLARLRESITRFGLIENLVVRGIGHPRHNPAPGKQSSALDKVVSRSSCDACRGGLGLDL